MQARPFSRIFYMLPVVAKRQEKMVRLTPEEQATLDMLTSKMIAKLPEWVCVDDLWE
jgi:hypothetical protein